MENTNLIFLEVSTTNIVLELEVLKTVYTTHWARIEFKFFEELPQEWMGDIKLGLKVHGKQESFKS